MLMRRLQTPPYFIKATAVVFVCVAVFTATFAAAQETAQQVESDSMSRSLDGYRPTNFSSYGGASVFSKVEPVGLIKADEPVQKLSVQEKPKTTVAHSSQSSASAKAATPKKTKQSKDTFAEIAPGIPAVLSENDVEVYRKLFHHQKRLERREVGKILSQLENDDILMGHLIAIRLLHPNFRTPYHELQDWLSKYNDHYPAAQLYRLANIRRPKGQSHKAPNLGRSMARYSDPDLIFTPEDKAPASTQRSRLLRTLRAHRLAVRYTVAEKIYEKPETMKILGRETWASANVTLARSMIGRGYFERAQHRAMRAVEESNQPQPEALWIAGFSAYNQRHFDDAASIFRRLVYSVPPRSRYYARAAWWAARAYEKMGRDSMARVFLSMATHDDFSFYGMLSAQRLDQLPNFSWEEPKVNPEEMQHLLKEDAIRRVIALAQIGEHTMAQQELQSAYDRVPYGMDETLLALSTALHLPKASMSLAKNLRERNKVYLTGLFPQTPAWQPQTGFEIDPALMFAIIRQESAFDPEARSHAGARGLMQIMPATSRHIRNMQRKRHVAQSALENPNMNMTLGQVYLNYLADEFDGNLIHMIAAYNAGPGNVRKWLRKDYPENDPILFIESIPFKETRNYVMHVMSNLWMYRQYYYGQTTTLPYMANHRWPVRMHFSLKNSKQSL